MSVKIILFGDPDGVNNILTTFRCRPLQQGEEIRVQNVQAGLMNYLLFAVKDLSLVVSQIAGAAGLMCFFSEKNVPQLRGELASMLEKHKELEGIPLVVAISTSSKSISLREIMSQLEQLKSKDRTTLIKQIDFESKSSIESSLQWLSSQRSSIGFDAQPRVVKAKPKYRDQPEGDKTYETLMKDKKFKAMSSINQQSKYLALEKQRIKQINMQDQLNKFIKNKQKMTPYDIKPSPNPRIQPNLNFFLKDLQDNKVQQTSIKIQTDQFKPRPPSPQYVPKKTGIDCSTQVQDNQLFDFDRQVQPILNVLTIRTLEQAILDIEQEQQMFKMTKFRQLYQYKKRQEKNLHRQYLLAQEHIMRQKQQLLKQRKARHENKLNCFQKVQAYKISNQLTKRIYSHTLQQLSTNGFVPNELHHQIQTDYLDHLLKQTGTKLSKVQTQTHILHNFFDQQCINPLLKISQPRKVQRQQKISKMNKRRTNKSENIRIVNLVFNNQPYFNQFILNFSQHFDGSQEQYQKNYQQQLKDIETKIATGEIPQDSLEKFKEQELIKLVNGRTGILLDQQTRYGFTLSHNQFRKTQKRYLSLKIIALDQNNQILQQVSTNEFNGSKIFEHNTEIRDMKQKVNFDESLQFELNKLQNVSALIFIVKISDLESLVTLQDCYKHASFGLESSVYAVPLIEKEMKDFNFLEFYKPDEEKGDEPTKIKSSCIVPYVLVNNKKQKRWYLQTVNHLTNPMEPQQQVSFFNQITQYWKDCCQKQKDAQQQEQIPQPPKKTSRQGKRRKSKQQQPPKKVVVQQVVQTPPVLARILPSHQINLNQTQLQSFIQTLQTQLKAYPDILSIYPHGYHFCIRGKPLTQISQLSKYKKIGDLTIVSNPEPIIEQAQDQSMIENQNQEEAND